MEVVEVGRENNEKRWRGQRVRRWMDLDGNDAFRKQKEKSESTYGAILGDLSYARRVYLCFIFLPLPLRQRVCLHEIQEIEHYST